MEENKTKKKKPDVEEEDPGPEMNQRSTVEVVNRYFVGDWKHAAKKMRRIDRWINRSLRRVKEALECIKQHLPDGVTMKPELYQDLIDSEEGESILTICRLQKDSLEIFVNTYLHTYCNLLWFGSDRLDWPGGREAHRSSGWRIKQAIEWLFEQLALLPEP